MRLNRLIIFLMLSMIFTSCGSLVDRFHRDMDADTKYKKAQTQQFTKYRSSPKQTLSSQNRRNVSPSTKRQYSQNTQKKKRYKADDLLDNSNNASLWSSDNEGLFTTNTHLTVGDIVVIEVQHKLKNEITRELKSAFTPLNLSKKKNEETKDATAEKATDEDKVYDKFTSIIIEEINQAHVLIKSQKNLLFNKRKRLIEVQSLIARKDISPDDTVSSNDFLETTVSIIR